MAKFTIEKVRNCPRMLVWGLRKPSLYRETVIPTRSFRDGRIWSLTHRMAGHCPAYQENIRRAQGSHMALHCRAELWKFRDPWYGCYFLVVAGRHGHGLTSPQKPSTSSTSTSATAPFFSSRHNRRQSPQGTAHSNNSVDISSASKQWGDLGSKYAFGAGGQGSTGPGLWPEEKWEIIQCGYGPFLYVHVSKRKKKTSLLLAV